MPAYEFFEILQDGEKGVADGPVEPAINERIDSERGEAQPRCEQFQSLGVGDDELTGSGAHQVQDEVRSPQEDKDGHNEDHGLHGLPVASVFLLSGANCW